MAFLERNLEQLTVVQRQLVEQNSSLKKEVAIAERKLIARNERIQSLENLLQDSQEKLTAANHRHVSTPTFFPHLHSSPLLSPLFFHADQSISYKTFISRTQHNPLSSPPPSIPSSHLASPSLPPPLFPFNPPPTSAPSTPLHNPRSSYHSNYSNYVDEDPLD